MNDLSTLPHKSIFSRYGFRITLLLCIHVVICCWSLAYVADSYPAIVDFNRARLHLALLSAVAFAVVSLLFAASRFSFGYFLGFYFYTMILGYLWLLEFSQLPYDHRLAWISIFLSGLAFFAPVLFITSPIRQRIVLSRHIFEILPYLILTLGLIVVAVGASYNFRLVNLTEIYKFREGLEFPALLRYATGITSSTLLPVAFACFVMRRKPFGAGAALLLILLFYPITLTRTTLVAPFWLLFLTLLSTAFEIRISVILSLLLPVASGIALKLLSDARAVPLALEAQYFAAINYRTVAIPSIALDVYNDFFSTHALTHFCQINIFKLFFDCPYDEQISLVMSKAYQLGALNASLFATEGIASVGPALAPLSALGCGLVIAFANRLSFGLPPKFIFLSSGVLPQIFLNVPLSTTLLSNGAALLFLLWYITPRTVLKDSRSTNEDSRQ